MCRLISQNQDYFKLFYEIDKKIFLDMKKNCCCPHCGGTLDKANYSRKPKGTTVDDPELTIRFSLCCRVDGCRKRYKVPSLRYFEQFHYYSSFFIYISMFLTKIEYSGYKLSKKLKIHLSTVVRWRKFWFYKFKQSILYKYLKGFYLFPEVMPRNFKLKNLKLNKIIKIFCLGAKIIKFPQNLESVHFK